MISDFKAAERKFFLGTCITLASIGSALAQHPEPKSAQVIDDPVYTHAQRLVEIEPGRKLNLYCTGSGSPTVVFDAGLTDEDSVWGFVQPVIAQRTRTCSYDRAGVGFSDAGWRPSSSENIVDDLHRLLAAASIKPPYVLVGHSYGGLNVKLFAYRYPAEVLGMVLVDPSHEDQGNEERRLNPDFDKIVLATRIVALNDCIAGARSGFKPDTALYKQCVNPADPHLSDAINAAHHALYVQPTFQLAQLTEEESLRGHTSVDQVRAARHKLGDMPLIVLTRTSDPRPLAPTETQQARDAGYRQWVALHDDIASLSTRGANRIVPNSGHYIQFDQPQAVNAAINEVLDALKIN